MEKSNLAEPHKGDLSETESRLRFRKMKFTSGARHRRLIKAGGLWPVAVVIVNQSECAVKDTANLGW